MKPILFRSAFLVSATIADVSFFTVLFPQFPPPIFLSVIVSLTLLKGFAFSWKWAVVGGVFLDSIVFSRIGGASFELALASAVFGLMARQFLFGYRMERLFLFGIGVWVFEFFARMTDVLFLSFRARDVSMFLSYVSDMNWSAIPWSMLFSLLLFVAMFHLTMIFERYLDLFERTNVGRR
jgi:hypothetical protein